MIHVHIVHPYLLVSVMSKASVYDITKHPLFAIAAQPLQFYNFIHNLMEQYFRWELVLVMSKADDITKLLMSAIVSHQLKYYNFIHKLMDQYFRLGHLLVLVMSKAPMISQSTLCPY